MFSVTRQTVSNWENEKSYPDLSTLVKISDEFNVSLDVLLKGDFRMVKDIDKKIKKQPYYIGIIIGLVIIAVALFSFIYANDKSISDNTKDYADFKLNSALSIEIYINPIYTLELCYNTTKQDTNDDIQEITIYNNGEYASFFTTSSGMGLKQNYKTNIDITELIGK